MDITEVVSGVRDAVSVRRVYGEAYERDGVTVIPAAAVRGGAGGGQGEGAAQEQGTGKGSGSGFGMVARPVGAYVIRHGEVRWVPVIDLSRLVTGAQIVAALALLTVRAIVRARSRLERKLLRGR